MPTTAEVNIKDTTLTTDDGYVIGFIAGGAAKNFDTRSFTRRRSVIKAISSTSYNLIASDEGKTLVHTSGSSSVIFIPLESSMTWPVGGCVEIMRNGAGTLLVSPVSGVTLSAAGKDEARVQGSVMWLRKIGTNAWFLTGDTV